MANLSRFRNYVLGMTELVARDGQPEPVLLDEGSRLLTELLAHDDWLPEEFSQSSSDGYRQYLLHCDPLERFSVVSFVWEPGQRTPVHDHLTWGLVGQLRGQEHCDEYARGGAGYVRSGSHRMDVGDIDRVSPTIGDIHAVSNASDAVSISIHVYGSNIGASRRNVYDAASGATKPFVSGYSNAWLPNLWTP